MIELTKGKMTDEIKERLINAKLKALEEGKVLNEKYLVPVEIKNKDGLVEFVGLFKRFGIQDYKDVYQILASETNKDIAEKLSAKLKAKGIFQTCIDACVSAVLCPSKEEFTIWANHYQFGAVSVANILLAEGIADGETAKGDWDFF